VKFQYEVVYDINLPDPGTDEWHALKKSWLDDQEFNEREEFLQEHAEDSQEDLEVAISQELVVYCTFQYESGNQAYYKYVTVLHDEVSEEGVDENVGSDQYYSGTGELVGDSSYERYLNTAFNPQAP
jgi:hypothetical protein